MMVAKIPTIANNRK